MNLKLGKLEPRHDDRTLCLANYLKPGALAAPPAIETWANEILNWGMMKNDSIGDCTIVGAAHMIEAWTDANKAPTPIVLSDDQVVAAYSAVSGYDPKTGQNDNGCVLLDVLNYWRTVGIGGDKISAYVNAELRNHEHIKQCVWLFGGCYIGLALPVSVQSQIGRTWSVVNGSRGRAGSWGGHCVNIIGYDAHGLTCVTWGAKQRMTWGFWNKYCDEAHGVLSGDWCNGVKPCPSGFDFATLQNDLNSL